MDRREGKMTAEGKRGQKGSGHSRSVSCKEEHEGSRGRTSTTRAWLLAEAGVYTAVNYSRMRVSRGSCGVFGINLPTRGSRTSVLLSWPLLLPLKAHDQQLVQSLQKNANV